MLCLDTRLFHVITFSIYFFSLINYYVVATILLVNKDYYNVICRKLLSAVCRKIANSCSAPTFVTRDAAEAYGCIDS